MQWLHEESSMFVKRRQMEEGRDLEKEKARGRLSVYQAVVGGGREYEEGQDCKEMIRECSIMIKLLEELQAT